MDRITNTDKWKDDWFLGLHSNAKLVFIFLSDNCDDAGFYPLNSDFMSKQMGLDAKFVVSSIRSMFKSVIIGRNEKGKMVKVWLKNFLFHQQQLPLEKNNKEHQKIRLMLEKNLKYFNNNDDINFILGNIDSSKSKNLRNTLFVKPSIVEFTDYGLQHIEKNKLNVKIEWIDSLYKYYESNGWMVGKNKMAKWKAAFSKNANNEHIKNSEKKGSRGRIDKLSGANNNITDVQVD